MKTEQTIDQKIEQAIKDVRKELGSSVKSIVDYCTKHKIKGKKDAPDS